MRKAIPFFVLSALAFSQSVAYAEEIENQLSYQQAAEKAFTTSYKLKNASADIKRSYEVRKEVEKNVNYIPATGSNEVAVKAFTGLVQADIGWEVKKKEYELAKDNIEYSVKVAYNSVLQAQQQKKLAEIAAENAEAQKNLMFVKYSNGIASQFELTQEENKHKSAVEKNKLAEKALQDAYQKLNNLIGLSKEERPELTDNPSFEKLEDDIQDLETHVSRVTTSSTAIWMAEQQVRMKKLDLDLYTYNVPGNDPYKAKEIDVDKAATNLADQKKQLEQGIRTLYMAIKQLEDRYDEFQVTLKDAEQTLNMVKVRYDAGLAIKADLLSTELAVINKKKEIFDLIVQHENLKEQYEKPWISSGQGNTSS